MSSLQKTSQNLPRWCQRYTVISQSNEYFMNNGMCANDEPMGERKLTPWNKKRTTTDRGLRAGLPTWPPPSLCAWLARPPWDGWLDPGLSLVLVKWKTWSRSGTGKLWPIGQIQPIACFSKWSFIGMQYALSLMYCPWPMSHYHGWQSWIPKQRSHGLQHLK